MSNLVRLHRASFPSKVQMLNLVSQNIGVLGGSVGFSKPMTSLRFYAGIGEFRPYEVVIDDKTYKSDNGEVMVLVERGATVSFTAQSEGCLPISGIIEVLQVNAEVGLPRFVVGESSPTPKPEPEPEPQPKQYTITVSVVPATATVMLGTETGVGIVSGKFDEGALVSYTASLIGYESEAGSVVVSKDETISLTLQKEMSVPPTEVGVEDIAVGGTNTYAGQAVRISEMPDMSAATAKTVISAKSIELGAGFTSSRVVSVIADEDISVIGAEGSPLVIDGAQPKTQGNATLSLNANGAVVVKNVKFAKDDGSYNALEIGLAKGSDPASVVIENVDFDGSLENNAISIFGTAAGAQVHVKGCTFKSCSNAVRLSNKLAVSGVSVVFEDCVLLECTETGEYRGFLLMEDHTSTSAAQAESRNVFGPDKLSITFINCTIGSGADAEVIDFGTTPAEGAPFANGIVNPKQAYYTFYDKGFGSVTGPVPYDEKSYPVLSFR